MNDADSYRSERLKALAAGGTGAAFLGLVASKEGFTLLLDQVRAAIRSTGGEDALREFETLLDRLQSAQATGKAALTSIEAYAKAHGLEHARLSSIVDARDGRFRTIALSAAIGALVGLGVHDLQRLSRNTSALETPQATR
ncbi:MAG: hypothetical protein NW215_00520 [Hyphomicrobiales bacterium]|nr:hypothetical protein [Hyphomicrobiales bacterium]